MVQHRGAGNAVFKSGFFKWCCISSQKLSFWPLAIYEALYYILSYFVQQNDNDTPKI